MTIVNLKEYAPIISDKEAGNTIYSKIKSVLENNEIVTVDFSSMISMATFCAKQIFGQLYVELGGTDFFTRIIIKNANDNIKTIINEGIESALNSGKKP